MNEKGCWVFNYVEMMKNAWKGHPVRVKLYNDNKCYDNDL